MQRPVSRVAVPRLPVSLAFVLAVSFGFLTSAVTVSQEEATPPPPGKILKIEITGQVFEGEPPFELFSNRVGISLRELTERLRKAATDTETAALILKLDNPLMDWVQVQTVRRELLQVRGAGKPVHCHLDTATTGTYLLASACSDVSLHPTGTVQLPGLQMNLIYLRDLFAKLGIRFEELRMGRYKSAAESVTRSGPSEASREALNSIIDHYYDELVDSIAENRRIKPVEVRALIDHSLFNAEEAQTNKLVDRLEYRDEFYARVRQRDGHELAVEDAKFGRDINLEVTGFMGFMNLFNEILGVPKGKFKSSAPKLAVINAVGPIVDQASGDIFGSEAVTADAMRQAFEEVRDDDSVKAVVFRVNSPGGSAMASDRILRQVELTAAKKPVVVSMCYLAASGGYYISCGATRILAERGTLTGSIGVIGAVPNIRQLFDDIGIRFETISRGKRAELVSPYGELSGEGRRVIMKFLEEIYDDFIQHVSEGRELSPEAVRSIAEGRVWTGKQALGLGLVDEIGGLHEAIGEARNLGHLDADAEIISYPKPKTLLDILQGNVRMPRVASMLIRTLLAELPPHVRQTLQAYQPLMRQSPATSIEQQALMLLPTAFVLE